MFTRQEAEKRGWSFPTDEDGFVLVTAPDGRVVAKVMSDTPYFFAVEHAAQEEGEPFPKEERDTATIKLVSGETYVEPPAPPAPEPEPMEVLVGELAKLDPVANPTLGKVIAAAKEAAS